MKKRLCVVVFALICMSSNLFGQDDIPIDNSLFNTEVIYVDKVFPTIQIFNLPTTNLLPTGEMKLTIAHRMGSIGSGIQELFGLYQANSRIGADLGLIKFVTIGLGSSSQKKFFDGYIKTRIIRQSNKFPLEMSLYNSIVYSALKPNYPKDKQALWQQIFYSNSLIFSKAFSKKMSAEVLVNYVHKNMVISSKDKNDILGFSGAITLKTGRKVYLSAEYSYLLPDQIKSIFVTRHIVSLGIQIHTGPRHVFQIFLSNSAGIIAGNVLTETTTKFSLNNLRICFNIPTTFKVY